MCTTLGQAYEEALKLKEAEELYKLQVAIEHQIKTPGEVGGAKLALAEINDSVYLCRLYVNHPQESNRIPEAKRLIQMMLDCVLINWPKTKANYAGDLRALVDRLESLGKYEEVTALLLDARWSHTVANPHDTRLETGMANTFISLGDQKSSFAYVEKIILIEKARMPKAGTPAYLISAYNDYANRLENQKLYDRAKLAREQAEQISDEWDKQHGVSNQPRPSTLPQSRMALEHKQFSTTVSQIIS
jgi:tetratricopeptide (TPR) repeat protein